MVHVHIQRQRLTGVSVSIPQGQQRFGRKDRPPDCFEPGLRHQGVEIRDVQVFVQMNGVVQPMLIPDPDQLLCLLQPVHLVLREVHIQLYEAQPKRFAQGRIFFQCTVLDQRRHAKLHRDSPRILRDQRMR